MRIAGGGYGEEGVKPNSIPCYFGIVVRGDYRLCNPDSHLWVTPASGEIELVNHFFKVNTAAV